MANHRKLRKWVKDVSVLCNPDEVVWIDGSVEQKKKLENEACSTGEIIRLSPKKLPGCFYHRTAVNDVARTENLTFICTKKQSETGPTNNWMAPAQAYRKAKEIFKGSMKGRKMYVIPFSMGPVGSPFSKIGIELTDSIYVVLNMIIMTHVGKEVLNALGVDGKFTKCLHGKADLDISKRLILHFPQDNAIWSVGSGYGGNVLLGKKCLSLRIASYLAKNEGWLAEHMLIMGLEDDNGHIQYLAGAFPSACGKTNLAMLIPPKTFQKKNYRVWTVGDDISWMRVDSDGALWAINPEKGFFGVAPGTNSNSNPNAVETVKKNTIFTNVVLKPDKTVWWEGADGLVPKKGIDWMGRPWKPGLLDEDGRPVNGAHSNSRFTAPISQCPSISFRLEHHHGVPVSAFIFGGRRAHLAPLVYESFDWQHGVYVAATMASERTSAQFGKLGEVRFDPMAMLPFCGYDMGHYFKHWLDIGKKMKKQPRIFHVNWFRIDKDGKFIWPGFGENIRVIDWILKRCNNEVGAIKTPIGYIPKPEDINIEGLDLSSDTLKDLLSIDKNEWREELGRQKEFLATFKDSLPDEIWQEYKALEKRLG